MLSREGGREEKAAALCSALCLGELRLPPHPGSSLILDTEAPRGGWGEGACL